MSKRSNPHEKYPGCCRLENVVVRLLPGFEFGKVGNPKIDNEVDVFKELERISVETYRLYNILPCLISK